jgi:hypothetical protein
VIRAGEKDERLNGISLKELEDSGSCLTVRPLKATHSKSCNNLEKQEDEKQGAAEVTSHEKFQKAAADNAKPKWSTGILTFDGKTAQKEFTVRGPFVLPLRLEVDPDQNTLFASVDVLSDVNECILTRISDQETAMQFVAKCTKEVAHIDVDGKYMFQAQCISKEESERICPVPSCRLPILDAKAARNHHSYHVIVEELVESTCPYCFGPVGCCLVYLSGGQPKSICQL